MYLSILPIDYCCSFVIGYELNVMLTFNNLQDLIWEFRSWNQKNKKGPL